MGRHRGIHTASLDGTPLAVIDFETTGLSAGYDRVVEVSVVRIDPGDKKPRLVFDSLVNPGRRVSASDIHGIYDKDVAKAPTFTQVAPSVIEAVSGCVVSAYNAYFDMRFLEFELDAAGIKAAPPPYVCARFMRSLLKLGRACRLGEACQEHGVPYREVHQAAVDAMATAGLMLKYLEAARRDGIKTFADLANLGSHKYLQSFSNAPLRPVAPGRLGAGVEIKSRAGFRPRS